MFPFPPSRPLFSLAALIGASVISVIAARATKRPAVVVLITTPIRSARHPD